MVIKERFPKLYRHATLDQKLNTQRHKEEVKLLAKCRNIEINVPAVYFVDTERKLIVMEYIEGQTVKHHLRKLQKEFEAQMMESDGKSSLNGLTILGESLFESLAQRIGDMLVKIHDNNIIHGDLTTSNVMVGSQDLQSDLVGDTASIQLTKGRC